MPQQTRDGHDHRIHKPTAIPRTPIQGLSSVFSQLPQEVQYIHIEKGTLLWAFGNPLIDLTDIKHTGSFFIKYSRIDNTRISVEYIFFKQVEQVNEIEINSMIIKTVKLINYYDLFNPSVSGYETDSLGSICLFVTIDAPRSGELPRFDRAFHTDRPSFAETDPIVKIWLDAFTRREDLSKKRYKVESNHAIIVYLNDRGISTEIPLAVIYEDGRFKADPSQFSGSSVGRVWRSPTVMGSALCISNTDIQHSVTAPVRSVSQAEYDKLLGELETEPRNLKRWEILHLPYGFYDAFERLLKPELTESDEILLSDHTIFLTGDKKDSITMKMTTIGTITMELDNPNEFKIFPFDPSVHGIRTESGGSKRRKPKKLKRTRRKRCKRTRKNQIKKSINFKHFNKMRKVHNTSNK